MLANGPWAAFLDFTCGRGTLHAQVYQGDCAQVIPGHIATGAVNLIITSPPYADQRNGNYEGIHPDKYVEWFST